MRIRTCDSCKGEIKSHEKYFKIVEQVWDGERLKQNHAGDICNKCFKEIIKKEK